MFTKLRVCRSLSIGGIFLTLSSAAIGMLGSTSYASSVGPGSVAIVGNSGYSTVAHSCDEYRNGYHIIMTGLVYAAGATVDGGDFGPITITFSDGTTAIATFTDLSVGTTAHFLNNTVNQDGNFTIVSAQMTFPAGSDITGFNQFSISDPPCGTVVPTTTTEAATTTTEAAPTTTAATPTTTEAPPTTVRSAAEVPLPLVTTTTTVVKVAAEAPQNGSSLPATGTNAGPTAFVGLLMLSSGLALRTLSRRTRSLDH